MLINLLYFIAIPALLFLGYINPNFTGLPDATSTTIIFALIIAISIPSFISYANFGFHFDGKPNNKVEELKVNQIKKREREIFVMFPWIKPTIILLVIFLFILSFTTNLDTTYCFGIGIMVLNLVWNLAILPKIKSKYFTITF